uniref:(northern house mosquito) hypothetical protein n=1 Tax=Culex pipiens TaxID=7175 RepID=A0A8D8HEC5_CULPI
MTLLDSSVVRGTILSWDTCAIFWILNCLLCLPPQLPNLAKAPQDPPLPPPPLLMLQDQDSVTGSPMDFMLTLTPTNITAALEARHMWIIAEQALSLMRAVSAVAGLNTK